ncbi:hypothetical protein ACRAWF_28725 [Streptomyces sp. L7]
MPTDPRKLVIDLRDMGGKPDYSVPMKTSDWPMVQYFLSGLLRRPVLPQGLRSAAYEALATVPGIKVVPGQEGRRRPRGHRHPLRTRTGNLPVTAPGLRREDIPVPRHARSADGGQDVRTVVVRRGERCGGPGDAATARDTMRPRDRTTGTSPMTSTTSSPGPGSSCAHAAPSMPVRCTRSVPGGRLRRWVARAASRERS